MPTYTVHAPPPREGETASAPERFRYVRDGFSFWAFLVPPLWLLARRLWLALLIWVVAYGLIEIGLVLLRATWGVQSLVAFLIGVLMGLEASSIERWTLARRGWKTLGFVVAGDAEMAEQRFFLRMGQAPAAGRVAPGRAARAAGLRNARRGMSRRRATRSSACFRNPGRRDEHGHRRLRLGQSALGRQGVRARRARCRAERSAIVVTSDPAVVAAAERVVLPGVGAFADCRRGLDDIAGMVEALNENVLQRGRPFLGICVGMQLMAERGREYQVTPGLGWIAGEVDRIAPSDASLKIPHMGWNTLNMLKPHPLLDDIPLGPDGLHAYFVHSYELKTAKRADSGRAGRLRRAAHRHRRPRQHGGHAVSPGKEPAPRAAADREFFEVEAVMICVFPACRARREGRRAPIQRSDRSRATPKGEGQ